MIRVTTEGQDAYDALPRCVRCNAPVKFNLEVRCEDCYADDAHKYSGKDQSVNTLRAKNRGNDA